ncbi:MAG: hypothetical protein ACK4F5_10705 [Aliihoeflea sp.]
MSKVRKIATFCIARAVFLASVPIYVVMIFLSSDPAFAFKAGAILTIMVAGALVWKADFVQRQEPSSTEVWLYLDNGSRPRSEQAKREFAEALRQVYGRFAQHATAIACIMFAISTGLLPIADLTGAAPVQMAGGH